MLQDGPIILSAGLVDQWCMVQSIVRGKAESTYDVIDV